LTLTCGLDVEKMKNGTRRMASSNTNRLPPCRGLLSLTLELNLSNSRTHS
jgi:hypothetical protein